MLEQNKSLPFYPAAPGDAQDQAALDIILSCLRKGNMPELDDALRKNAQLMEVLEYIQSIQQGIVYLAQGNYNKPIQLKGYSGGLLKSLQSNSQHIIWKAKQIANGEFSQQLDFMGEMAEAFNDMAAALEKARRSLEEQKHVLTEMTENLRQEVQARIAAETELKREEMRQRQLASTDQLTGLLNRRGFFQLAQREIERMRRGRAAAGIALLDLDNFKQINDTFGHEFGDAALCSLARSITKTVRSYDIAARFGGDEFVLLFPEISLSAAYTTLERLRQVREKEALTGESHDRFTISGGLAMIRITGARQEDTITEALSRADKALYASKLKGRNCISLAE